MANAEIYSNICLTNAFLNIFTVENHKCSLPARENNCVQECPDVHWSTNNCGISLHLPLENTISSNVQLDFRTFWIWMQAGSGQLWTCIALSVIIRNKIYVTVLQHQLFFFLLSCASVKFLWNGRVRAAISCRAVRIPCGCLCAPSSQSAAPVGPLILRRRIRMRVRVRLLVARRVREILQKLRCGWRAVKGTQLPRPKRDACSGLFGI